MYMYMYVCEGGEKGEEGERERKGGREGGREGYCGHTSLKDTSLKVGMSLSQKKAVFLRKADNSQTGFCLCVVWEQCGSSMCVCVYV